jgi:hypothetical protein
MTFDELNIGDMFNTKEARYVKISDTKAIVVMSSLYDVGTKMFFKGVVDDVVVLYTTISKQQHTKPILGQEAVCAYGLGRVMAFHDDFPNSFIEVITYVDGISRQYSPDDVKLVPIKFS